MAKNKRSADGFDKFGNRGSSSSSVMEEPESSPTTTLEVPEDEESDSAEPTDVVTPEEMREHLNETEDLGRGPIPAGAYRRLDAELARATTVADQEAIIAKMHAPCRREDPAANYRGCLVGGRSLPPYTPKAGTDPLLIRSKDLLERLLAGGLIVPSAQNVYLTCAELVADIIATTKGETDAEPDAGSSGGQTEVVG